METKTTLELRTDEAWNNALRSWNYPSIPPVIIAKTSKDLENLGDIAPNLKSEFAFMRFLDFQTYAITLATCLASEYNTKINKVK